MPEPANPRDTAEQKHAADAEERDDDRERRLHDHGNT
jgi:hypothetical protein